MNLRNSYLIEAFTLLELLLVIAIVAVLGSLIIFNLNIGQNLENTNETVVLMDQKQIAEAINDYVLSNNGNLPPVLSGLETGLYDLCLPGEEGCTENSVDLDILVEERHLSEIPIKPGCTSSITTCYIINFNAQSKTLTLDASSNPVAAFLGYDWSTAVSWVQPSTTITARHLSAAKKSNGNIALVNISGNSIVESEVSNITTLLTVNNSATVWQDTGIVTISVRGVSIFNVEDQLFLSVHDSGNTSAEPATYKIYRSPSGNGNSDWELYSTVASFSYTTPKFSSSDPDSMAGDITVLSSGTWTIKGPYFDNYSGNMRSRNAAYISNDEGVTWTSRGIFGEGINAGGAAYYSGDMPKRIVETDSGAIYSSSSNTYAGLNIRL